MASFISWSCRAQSVLSNYGPEALRPFWLGCSVGKESLPLNRWAQRNTFRLGIFRKIRFLMFIKLESSKAVWLVIHLWVLKSMYWIIDLRNK